MPTIVAANRIAASRSTPQANIGQGKQPKLNMYNINNVAAVDIYDKRPPCRDGEESSYSDSNYNEERNYINNDIDDTNTNNFCKNNNINNKNGTHAEQMKIAEHVHNKMKRHVRLSECRLPEMEKGNIYPVNQCTTLPSGGVNVPIRSQQKLLENGKNLLLLEIAKETMSNRFTLPTQVHSNVNNSTNQKQSNKNDDDSVREYQENLLREINLLRANPEQYSKFIEQECTLGSPFVECLHDLYIDSDVNADVIEYMRSMIVKSQNDEVHYTSNCHEPEINLHTSAVNKGNGNKKALSPHDSGLSSDMANSSNNTSNEWITRHVPDANRKRQSTCDETKKKNVKEKRAHKRSSAAPNALSASPLALFDGVVNADSKTRLSYLTNAKGEAFLPNVINEGDAIEQNVRYIVEMNEGTLSDHGLCELTREQLKVQYKRHCTRFNSLTKVIKLINEQHTIHVQQAELEEQHQQEQLQEEEKDEHEENKKDERAAKRLGIITTTTTTTPSTSFTGVNNTSSITSNNNNNSNNANNSKSILTNNQSKRSNSSSTNKNVKLLESKRAATLITSHASSNNRMEEDESKRFTITVPASMTAAMNEQTENATLQADGQQHVTSTTTKSNFNVKMQILCTMLVECKATCERMQRGLVLFAQVLEMLREIHYPLPPLTVNTGLMLTSQAIMRELSVRSNRTLTHKHHDDNVNSPTRTNSPLTYHPTSQINTLQNDLYSKSDMSVTSELVSEACSNYGYQSGTLSVLCMTDHTSSVTLTPRAVVMRSLLCTHMTHAFHIAENSHTNTPPSQKKECEEYTKRKEEKYSNDLQRINDYNSNKDLETDEENKVQTAHPLLMPHNRLFGCRWVRRMCHTNMGNKSNRVGSTIVFLMITSSGFEELRLIHSYPMYNVDALNRIVMERKCNAMISKHEMEEFHTTTCDLDKNNNNNNIYSNKTNEMSKYYLKGNSNNNISMHNSCRKYKNHYDNTLWPQSKLTSTCSFTLPSTLPISLSRPFTADGAELNIPEHGASATQSYCTKAMNAGKFDTEVNAVMKYKENEASSLSETLRTAVIDIHSSFDVRLLYPTEHPMRIDLRENVACILLDCTARSILTHDCINSSNEKNEKINNAMQEEALCLNSVEITATIIPSSVLSSMSFSSPLHNSRLTLVQPSTVDDNITTILINTRAVFEEFREYRCMYSKGSSTWESVEVKVHLFERLPSASNANVNHLSSQNCTSTNMQHMTQIELTKTNEFEGTDNISDRLFTISGFHHIGFVRICITNNSNYGNTHTLQSVPTALRPHIEYLKAIEAIIAPHEISYVNEQSSFSNCNHYCNNVNEAYKGSIIPNYKDNNNNRSCEYGWPEVSLSFHNYHATLLAPLSRTITVTPGQSQIYFALCLPLSHADKTQNVYTKRKTMELRKLLMDLYLEQEADNLLIQHNENHRYKISIDNCSNSTKRESKENTEWNVLTQSDTTAEILTINNNNNSSKSDFSGAVKNVNDNADNTIALIDKAVKMTSTQKLDEMTQIESINIIDMSLEKEVTRDGAVSTKNKEYANNDNANQEMENSNNDNVKKVNSSKKEAAQNTILNNNSSRKEVNKKYKHAKKEKQQQLSKQNNRNELLVELSDQNKHENPSTHDTNLNNITLMTRANQTKQTNNNNSKAHSKESAEVINNAGNREEEQESLFSLPLSEDQEKLLVSTNASCSLAQMRAVLAELRKMESDWITRLERAETWLNEELLDFDVTHESVMNNSHTGDSGGSGNKKNSFNKRSARGNVAKKNNKMANSTSSDLVNNHSSDSINEQANELCNREENSGDCGNANNNSYSNSSITSINSSGSINAKNNHGLVTVTATNKLAKGKKSNAHAANIIVVKGTGNQSSNANSNNTNSSVKKIKGKELLKWQTNRENMRCKLAHMKERVNQLRSKISHVRVLLLQKERTSLIRSDKIIKLEKELADLSRLDSLKDKTTDSTHLLDSQNVPNYHSTLLEQHREQQEQCNVELWLCTTSTQWTSSKSCQLNSISESKEQSESVHSPIKIAQLHCCQNNKHVNVVNNAQLYDGQCTLPANVHGTLRMTVNGEELVRWQVR